MESIDVCLVLELLEHVAEWQACRDECARVLRPGVIVYLSTATKVYPVQDEFDLPLYSWYLVPLKRYFERLARTSRPDLVSYAKYPALHGFTFVCLRMALASRGFSSSDRFDVMDLSQKRTRRGRSLPSYEPCLPCVARSDANVRYDRFRGESQAASWRIPDQ